MHLTRPGRLLLLGVLGLTGCVRLGPDFQSPKQAWIEHWNTPALDQSSQRGLHPDLQRWWQVFGDPVLDRLIADADANNSDLRIAGLRVMEARAQLGIALSGRYPQVQQASADSLYVNRRQFGGNNPQDAHFWQYSAGFDVGWELDFWGRFSRAIESADAGYFAAQANYEDVLVLLRAQVADTYFSLRTTEARLRVAHANARQQKRNFEITEKLFNSGQQAELDLQQARTQYLGTLSTIPNFEDQVLRLRNALAALIGQPPGALPQLLENQGLIPLVDRAVLQDVPANLLLRRPDVRAAELNVAAQSALIGVAETDTRLTERFANEYPDIPMFSSTEAMYTALKGQANITQIAAPNAHHARLAIGKQPVLGEVENQQRTHAAAIYEQVAFDQAMLARPQRGDVAVLVRHHLDHVVGDMAHAKLLDAVPTHEDAQLGRIEVVGVIRDRGVLGRAELLGRAPGIAQLRLETHQPVEGQLAGGHQFVAVFVEHGRHAQATRRQVQRGHGAQAEGEPVVVRQHLVRQAFLVDVQRAGRHFVQRRLPDVEQLLVHQRHLGHAELAPQLAGQFQAARATSHDHDPVLHLFHLSGKPASTVDDAAAVQAGWGRFPVTTTNSAGTA